MLTARGWWLLMFLLSMLALMVLGRLLPLVMVSVTLLLWFAAEWALFALRTITAVRSLRVERVLRDDRGPVEGLWSGKCFDVRVGVRLDGQVDLSYVRLQERVPFGVEFVDGQVRYEGEFPAGETRELRYRVRCLSPGRVRFEGLALRLVDLQGFFHHVAFVQAVREYRVLPPLVDAEGQPATVKRFNLLPSPGQHRHARPGSGSELLDLRDYRPGDPPKTIAWKVSARRDRLITKEFESEVPVRCTLFVDTSNSVRLGPRGRNALTRLVEIAAAVSQAAVGVRDLVGVCLFDDRAVTSSVRPARGQRHLVGLLNVLADAAGLAPASGSADVGRLVRLANVFAEEVYPHLVDPGVNALPVWLPWLRPRPASTRRRPTLADRVYGRLPWWLAFAGLVGVGLTGVLLALVGQVAERVQVPAWVGVLFVGLGWLVAVALVQRLVFPQRRRRQRWRKRLAALLSVRYGLAPGGLALLLEDDEHCALLLERFLAEHHVPYALPYYDERGRYLFASPAKLDVLAEGLLRAIGKGHDNELFVLLVDCLELADRLEPLLRAVKVALARHHQIMVICPWPPGVAPPPLRWSPPKAETGKADLERIEARRLHQAYHQMRRRFTRLGVPVLCARGTDPVPLVLDRLARLRVPGRRR